MRKVIMIMMAVALVALPAIAQNYGKPYLDDPVQRATAPASSFQSTGSTMMSSGSTYSANPSLNEDGTASYGSASTSTQGAGGRPGTIKRVDDDNDGYDDETGLPVSPGAGGTNLPLGDAMWPLALLAGAYCGFMLLRRRSA